jgi:hypothetical protein
MNPRKGDDHEQKTKKTPRIQTESNIGSVEDEETVAEQVKRFEVPLP